MIRSLTWFIWIVINTSFVLVIISNTSFSLVTILIVDSTFRKIHKGNNFNSGSDNL